MKLNEQQEILVNHKDGNVVCFAGAGSGKTFTIIERTRRLVESGVPQSEVLLITFTNASALDLKKKLINKGLKDVNCGTYHSVCARILLSHGVDVSRRVQAWEVENLFARMNGNQKVDLDDVLGFISYQKNHGITYKDKFVKKESMYKEYELRMFFEAYENLKKSKKAYDFDDYLLECLKLYESGLCNKTWEYLQVDENQDNNSIQSRLLKYLCPKNNITLVGDEKQSIYGFRGSRPELFLNAPSRLNARVVHLNTNYRSSKCVVDVSNKFADRYFGNYEFYKPAIANSKDNGSVKMLEVCTKEEEASKVVERIKKELLNGVKPNEIVVLYRNHSMAAAIEFELKANNIEYDIETNGSFFKQRQIEVILSILRLAIDPEDNNAYEFLFKSRVSSFKYMRNSVMDDIRSTSSKYNIGFLEASTIVNVEQNWQKKKLEYISDLVNMVVSQYRSGVRLNMIIENIIRVLDMKTYLEDTCKNQDELEVRLESLETLLGFASGNSIDRFLKYAYETSLARKKDKSENVNAIKLQTIHKSKGLEFDVVFLIGLFQDRFPYKKSPIQEECCVFYVGITRAKERLYISGNMGSQFFEDISEGLSSL
jgi:DNA helicase-2/ATP-dependent DNA helicase PcrA|nr:MAG TPA: REP HELICASE [Caudoviricetes sp.]